MWTVLESKKAQKALDKAQPAIVANYDAWRAIVILQGPGGLRAIKGFHDEALGGKWTGHRSSRLSKTFRVFYRIDRDQVIVYVEDVNAHDYRR